MIGVYGNSPTSQQRHTDTRNARLAEKHAAVAARLAQMAGAK